MAKFIGRLTLTKLSFCFFWVVLLSGLFLFSCRPTRRLSDGEYLLKKNEVKIDNEEVDKDELEGYIRQKPNRKIFGFYRFHLQVYNIGKGLKPESKMGNWLMNTVGEEPVIWDKTQTDLTKQQFELYLANKGYFNATVEDSVTYRKKKACVVYSINTGRPYIIGNIAYTIKDENIRKIVTQRQSSLIKSGKNYDVDVIQKERESIAELLKNRGYYYFAKEFIYFEADSSVGGNKVDINLYIKNIPVKEPNEVQATGERPHELYYLNNIYINTDYSLRNKDTTSLDTLVYENVHFIYKKKLKYKPETILRALAYSKPTPDTLILYAENRREKSYQYLAGLRAFRYVNIEYKEAGKRDDKNLLDCMIQLTPSLKQAFSIETRGTHTAGNLGVAGEVTFQNKNLLKGAERLDISVAGGLEAQVLFDNSDNANINNALPFNTIEFSPEIRLTIPRLVPSILKNRLSKYTARETHFSVSYNFQQRPDFTRSIITGSYGYDWYQSRTKRWILNPVEINAVNVYNESDAFKTRLNNLTNQLIKRSFEPHLTTVTNLSFIYNNQAINKNRNFTYFMVKGESSGNLLRLGYLIADPPANSNEEKSYKIAGIPFAQYLKLEGDVRRYWVFNTRSMLVGRVMAGAAYPLPNLEVLPFESSFIAGGANGNRAWATRTLGPGGYEDETNLDQFGDVKLEFNLEYRFDIYKWFKGAVFTDAGNIWLMKKDDSRENANFDFKRLHKELGWGTGLGVRLDFDFFVLRVDAGYKLYRPNLPDEHKWISFIALNKINFNIGIGYPF